MDWSVEVAHEERALEVLIGMTAKTLCRRSNIHLEQALLLIEVSLGHANAHWKMLNEQFLARKHAALEVQLKAAKATEAEAAKLLAEAKEKAVAAQQDSRMETSTSEAQAAQPAQSAATQAANSPEQQPTESASQQASASATESAAGASAAGAAPSTDQAGQEKAIPEPNQEDNPEPVIQSLPGHLLKHLARLLGQSGLSDLAQKRCASVIKMMVDISSGLKPLMLTELQQELQR